MNREEIEAAAKRAGVRVTGWQQWGTAAGAEGYPVACIGPQHRLWWVESREMWSTRSSGAPYIRFHTLNKALAAIAADIDEIAAARIAPASDELATELRQLHHDHATWEAAHMYDPENIAWGADALSARVDSVVAAWRSADGEIAAARDPWPSAPVAYGQGHREGYDRCKADVLAWLTARSQSDGPFESHSSYEVMACAVDIEADAHVGAADSEP